MPRRAGVALTLTCALALLLLAGCGGSSSRASSFVGDADDLVLYVSWNRDGDTLSGSLTQGLLENGERVQTSRSSLTGKVSGSGVSLDLRQPSGASSTLSGKLDGDALTLEYLRPDEGLVTIRLRQGAAGDFNAALATLQDRVEQSKADAQTDAAKTTEQERVAEHASIVQDDIAALKLAVGPAPKGTKGAADPARLRRDLQTLRAHAEATQRAGELSVCSQAATVQSDLSSLELHVGALQRKQSNRGATALSVNEAIDKLREDFLALRSDEARYLPPDAPTQRTVGRAIEQARRRLRKRDPSSTASSKAVAAILAEARSLQDRASLRCRTGGG